MRIRDATLADLAIDPEPQRQYEGAYRRGVHHGLALAGDLARPWRANRASLATATGPGRVAGSAPPPRPAEPSDSPTQRRP
jgi:hypothetical protein